MNIPAGPCFIAKQNVQKWLIGKCDRVNPYGNFIHKKF